MGGRTSDWLLIPLGVFILGYGLYCAKRRRTPVGLRWTSYQDLTGHAARVLGSIYALAGILIIISGVLANLLNSQALPSLLFMGAIVLLIGGGVTGAVVSKSQFDEDQ